MRATYLLDASRFLTLARLLNYSYVCDYLFLIDMTFDCLSHISELAGQIRKLSFPIKTGMHVRTMLVSLACLHTPSDSF
jgi:hypothetical protein